MRGLKTIGLWTVTLALAAGGVTFAATANASGSTTYLDCSQSANGDGSQTSPYNNIATVNALTFGPGDTLAVKAGTSCTGTLSPKGSGTSTAPISVQPYGAGAAPVINGNGTENALTLTNQDNWTIGAIKLTNPASAETQREGLLIQSTDGTAHSGFDINGLLVDNVAGETNKATNAAQFSNSAGIRFGAVNTGSLLNNVHVHNTQVTNCGGGGIKVRVGGTWGKGGNVLVEQNTVGADGGDGIIVSYAEAPMIQYNTGANLGTGTYPYTGGNFAGMWVLGDHNPTLQHNVVYGTIMSAVDSEAFDCDWGNTGTCLVQYNYTHDNAGGLFLNCDGCGTSGAPTEVVRYNVAQNDCRTYTNGNAVTLWFYNNDIYCPNKALSIAWPSNTKVWNNIWVGNGSSTLPTGTGIDYEWNVYQGVTPPTSNGITGNPGFAAPGTGGNTLNSVDGYKLTSASPAFGNGAVVSNNGGQDYWGNPVSATAKPNRGAYNGAAVAGGSQSKTGPIVGLASKCVDDSASGTADGNPIILYHCTGGQNQSWTFPGDGTIQVFGKCLSLTGSGTANGTLTVLRGCDSGTDQQWTPTNGNLVNPQSTRCLDVPGSNSTDGTQLEIWDCGNAQPNQTWTIPA